MKKNASILTGLALAALLTTSRVAVADTTNYIVPGDFVWTCPPNVSSVLVECWGGGGAGGGAKSTGNNARGGGGAGGSYAQATVGVTAGTDYNVHVAAGGVCLSGFVGNSAYPGGYSSFSNVDNTVCYALATGGVGGKSVIANNNNGAGGIGATTGNIGSLFFAGGTGGTAGAAGSGGGGGGAGNVSPGTNAVVAAAGAGGTDGGGIGAAGRTAVNAGLSATVVAGGGGGGAWGNSATERLGGSGAGGKVVLTYTAGAVVPVVVASAATSIGTSTATFNGDVTSDGGSAVTERGFVYKNSAGVTIDDNKTVVSGTTGAYSTNLTLLGVNVDYFFRAYAINAIGTTLSTAELSFWTLANTPIAPTVNNPTASTLDVAIGGGDGNPANTTYAIHETSMNLYVQTNGMLGTTAVYQTASSWATKTVTGLLSGMTYTFEVKAKNGGGVLTAFGPTTSNTTTGPATTKIQPETKADGSGVAVTDQTIMSGNSFTVYAIARTAADVFVANVSANWSLQSKTGGVADGDLTPTNGTSATFTGNLAGTATIRATLATLTATDSGTIAVVVPETFTSSGSWVCPDGVTSVKVECWGGGGAGGAAHNSSGTGNSRGGGGAGGSYSSSFISVVPGTTYNVTVGTGGVSQSGFVANTAYAGSYSSFSNLDNTVCYVLANGGGGGKSSVVNNVNGSGGIGTVIGNIGDIILAGGSGGTGGGAASGAGGGGAGNSTPGGSAGNNIATPGAGGVAGGGIGAAGVTVAGSANSATVIAGGGGGGAWANSAAEVLGGSGASGKVVLSYGSTLVWQGDGGANQWNTSAANWTNSTGSASVFTNGSAVLFDDTSANNTVALAALLSPVSVTVNASAKYTFTGGTLFASPSLLKAGTGVLDLGAASRNFGPVVITGGTITNGTLSGSSFGGESGTVNATLAGAGSALTKSTTGLLTLSGANTYTGNTTISAGTLSIAGSLGTGAINVNGGVLGGTGNIAGAVTVASGGFLAPGAGDGTLNGMGNLTVNSNLTLLGTTVMQINRTGSPLNDTVTGIATLTVGGTLIITNAGNPLQVGDTFTLFSASTFSGSFAATNLPALAGGLAWDTSVLGTSGTISVVSGIITDPPPTLTNSVAGGQIQLSWGAGYQGYTLQQQTNALNVGLGTNWEDIPGSTSMTSTNITIDPSMPATFYRLIYTP